MHAGETLGRYIIGPKIGQGTFGDIYAAKDINTNVVVAIKTELSESKRKTLEFEKQVFIRIQDSPYFPRYIDSGVSGTHRYVVMDLIGPSLSSILSFQPEKKFSMSTGLRVSFHVFQAVYSLHQLGFIHRDIKPENVLVRLTEGPPVCLIDFGLVRVFRDRSTKVHIPPRDNVSFRGTKMYSSWNAHLNKDLSRRDDLISWFYLTFSILYGSLPWQGVSSHVEISALKATCNFEGMCDEGLVAIWQHLRSLQYADEPNYKYVSELLNSLMRKYKVRDRDPYDWSDYLQAYKSRLIAEMGEISERSFYDESPKRRFSTDSRGYMPLSEVNEAPGRRPCCGC